MFNLNDHENDGDAIRPGGPSTAQQTGVISKEIAHWEQIANALL
jgi:hypothetical protein